MSEILLTGQAKSLKPKQTITGAFIFNMHLFILFFFLKEAIFLGVGMGVQRFLLPDEDGAIKLQNACLL